MSDTLNKKVEQVITSFDGIERASPKPFLLTRINAAIQKQQEASKWAIIAYYLKKPVVAAMGLFLILLVNIMVIKSINENKELESLTKSTAPQKYDFAINVSVMYDSENLEP